MTMMLDRIEDGKSQLRDDFDLRLMIGKETAMFDSINNNQKFM